MFLFDFSFLSLVLPPSITSPLLPSLETLSSSVPSSLADDFDSDDDDYDQHNNDNQSQFPFNNQLPLILLMHGGHAHARLSFKPPSVPASPSLPSSALGPLSPLSDLSSSPPLTSIPSGARTRLASGSSARPSQRRRDAAEHAVPPSAPTPSIRRMRPLACMASNANAIAGAPGTNAQAPVKQKAWRMDAWRENSVQLEEVHHNIDFPPKHVVLHPDDANNKVFLAMGRALMSVVRMRVDQFFVLPLSHFGAQHPPFYFYYILVLLLITRVGMSSSAWMGVAALGTINHASSFICLY